MSQINWQSLGFDAYRTRTLVTARWKDGVWSEITESEDFAFHLDPFTCVFHYAFSCFEGLKAFTQKDGRIVMFRPYENAHRLRRTAGFLGLPAPSDSMFIEMCERCVKSNMEFLAPYGHDASLYLNSKTHEYVDEFGSSNFFGIKGNTYVTPLSDSVLPSITNKSLQEIALDLGMKVEKRPVRLEELSEFEEAGGCGTAVVITPMSHIDVKEVLEEEAVKTVYRYLPDGEVGPVCAKLYKTITSIQKGEIEDIHGWCHEIR